MTLRLCAGCTGIFFHMISDESLPYAFGRLQEQSIETHLNGLVQCTYIGYRVDKMKGVNSSLSKWAWYITLSVSMRIYDLGLA